MAVAKARSLDLPHPTDFLFGTPSSCSHFSLLSSWLKLGATEEAEEADAEAAEMEEAA